MSVAVRFLIKDVPTACVWPMANLRGWWVDCLINGETEDCPLLCICISEQKSQSSLGHWGRMEKAES